MPNQHPAEMSNTGISTCLQVTDFNILLNEYDKLCQFIKSDIHKAKLDGHVSVEEILAELCIEIYNASCREHQIKYPLAWLKFVAKIKIVDHQRQAIKERTFLGEASQELESFTDDDTEKLLQNIDLESALSKLDPESERIVRMKAIERKSYDEIAKSLARNSLKEIRPNTLAAKYKRAIAKLRELYKAPS
jgi:RNA polymerase sigma factor (sigma-70 family)